MLSSNGVPAQTQSVPLLVHDLLGRFTEQWWATETSLPPLGPAYTLQEQRTREKSLEQFINTLLAEAQRPPRTPEARRTLEERLYPQAASFTRLAFGLEGTHLEALRSYRFLEVAAEFARQARRFDPEIAMDDIAQACRNVWSMNLMQLLFGRPVEITPAVFAYSMLYPYTDNYLDDPAVSTETKRAFNRRFYQRLEGEAVKAANRAEQLICDLVGVIESQFERARYPQVYASLLAIHAAQGRSLALQGSASPYEVDALGICFEKGGTSTLADACLVVGDLTEAQRDFAFYYGCVTQLVDDLEDVQSDARAGIMTIFAQTAGRWPLDAVTNRTLHFSLGMASAMEQFDLPGLGPLREMIQISLRPLLIDSASRAAKFYTRPYLRTLEAHFPFRFGALYNQRKRLYQRRVTLNALAEAFLQ